MNKEYINKKRDPNEERLNKLATAKFYKQTR